MTDVNNTGNKVRGNNNNFGIINGLNEKEVGEIIAKAKEEILKQLAASNSDIASGLNAQGNDVADRLSGIICNKLCELVSNIDATGKSTEENIKAALQSKLDALSGNLSSLVDSVTQDITSLNNALSDEFKKSQDRHNEVLKRIDSRYYWMQQEAEIKYINLLEHLKSFKADCRVELLRGHECIKDAKFADAEKLFERALQQDEVKADAYFGLALAQCKVQLVWDYYYDCEQPILYEYRVKSDFFCNNAHYKAALDYATPNQTQKFQDIAAKIELLLTKFWDYSEKEDSANDESFGRDCFICVKVSDPQDKNKTTADCDWVFKSKLYDKLKARKLRPFFSEIDVPKSASRDPEYEAKILYALYKAKCMILVCSNEDFLETPYVKNEYNRFLNFARSKGLDDKQLIIVFNGVKISRRALNIFNLYGIEDFDRSRLTVDDLVDWVEARVNKANGCMSAGWLYCPACGKKYQLGSDKCSVAGHGALVDFETYANMLIVRKNAENETLNNKLQDLASDANQIEQEKRRLQEERQKLAAERKKLEEEKNKLQQQSGDSVVAASPTKDAPTEIASPENCDNTKPAVHPEDLIVNADDIKDFTIVDGVLTQYVGSSKEVVIPYSAKSQSGDFRDSKLVTSIGDDAFYNCDSMESVKIPQVVESIGSNAFHGCSSLTSVTIPFVFRLTVGNSAFRNCSNLRKVSFGGNVNDWCDIFWGNEYSNPLYYAHNLFINNRLIEELVISASVTEIKPYAFCNCTSITDVTLGNGVTSIGSYAFEGCSNITDVLIPDSVTTIGGGAFSGCSSLTSVTISDSVTEIEYSAFFNCTKLTSVTIPDKVKKIGAGAFSGCSSLKRVTFGGGVRSIGVKAFCDCTSLKNLTIPKGVEVIELRAFKGCTALETVSILSDAKIEVGAFEKCSSLKEISYRGTKRQWQKNSKECINKYGYVVHCTDGDIIKY